ncbi:hypothetical protein BG003_001657, partial [Podila horticola]
MPATSQKFKFGSSERELDLIPSRVPHEFPFIYVDDVLEAFEISHAVRFEADGRTIAYVRDDNGKIKSTVQIQEDMKIVTDIMIARNRAGKSLDVYSIIEESSSAVLAPPVSVKSGFKRTVIHKLDELYGQGSMTQQIAREVLKLQKQMNDRLILIQSKTEAILTQQLELAEYPIPRLFLVLPEESVMYDPCNWFRTKFRLHFICECGKHTEASNSKVPHHLHLAKHEGYLIREPTEFFKKYGPFLLLMLELVKFGTSIAGHVVPTLASLKAVELVDSVKQTVESVTAKIDYSLE